MSSPSNIGVAELIHALEAACDKVTVLQEQQLLQEWQSQPGYHAALSVVALDQTVSTAVRLMACTQLKNGIEYRYSSYFPSVMICSEFIERPDRRSCCSELRK